MVDKVLVRALCAFATDLHDEFFDTMIQIPFRPPLVEIPVHGLPFRKVVGKHTPLTSADQKIKNMEHKEYLRCLQSFSKNTLFI